ncbi:hypothetical protein B0H10DRAFT_2198554 [Mycena sp. CBHHK59/15]|nr:hypothetical protein B0H10DRAFT_2198554 [Mycena sp. CBHHK59/15]
MHTSAPTYNHIIKLRIYGWRPTLNRRWITQRRSNQLNQCWKSVDQMWLLPRCSTLDAIGGLAEFDHWTKKQAAWSDKGVEVQKRMLRRLGETNPPGIRFRMAFVTYGTQGTPLICKNFFTDIGPVMQAFKEDTSRLGIGQTTCGGGTGMAALEGFVAAIEKAQPKNPSFPPVYHIFHVAAAQPDCSEHPQLNFSASLDDVTWKSLPSELKKRNIHLSSINVRPKLPKFSELHSTCSTSPVAPWFPSAAERGETSWGTSDR